MIEIKSGIVAKCLVVHLVGQMSGTSHIAIDNKTEIWSKSDLQSSWEALQIANPLREIGHLADLVQIDACLVDMERHFSQIFRV